MSGSPSSVRVHGDYWLGNLLVDESGSYIVGVIDWSDTGWGTMQEDLAQLVDTWVRQAGLGSSAADQLRADARNVAATALAITLPRADASLAEPAAATSRPAD